MLRKICTLNFAVILVLFAAFPLSAQNGEPAIATSSSAWSPSPAYIDAYIETGGSTGGDDMCTRLQTLYNSSTLFPLSSGNSAVVDARGFTNNNVPTGFTSWACSVNPFTSTVHTTQLVPVSGKLLLGYVNLPIQTTWVVPTHMIVEGIGTNGTGILSGTNPGANTVLYAASTLSEGLAAELAVIQMGIGSSTAISFGVQIRDLTVDCNDVAGTYGIVNVNAEEGSLVNNVQIFDCPEIGLHVTASTTNSPGYGAVNSGPYEDVFINYTSACSGCTTALALQVDGDTTTSTTGEGRSIRGFDNFTVSGNNVTNGTHTGTNSLVNIYGISTSFTNSHAEYCVSVCIQIGNNSSYVTYGVRISDVTVSNDNGSYDVEIYNPGSASPPNVGNILIENLNHESINSDTIDDLVTGNTVPDNYVGWYWLGAGATSGSNKTPAVYTSSPDLSNSGTPYALKVVGNADVTGSIAKGSSTFKIDHPLDPEHEYLYHSVVESPDMMNIYNGSVTTDKRGLATVILPDYFEALNRDFRYQLTPIGQFAQAMVAEKIKGNRFVIKTSKPGVEVSWQVSGIRHDAYANQHPMHVEEPKPESVLNH